MKISGGWFHEDPAVMISGMKLYPFPHGRKAPRQVLINKCI
jgi:hypothetical protein